MLKKIRLLFLGLVVIAGSACVTPTHASSAQSVVLTYVQATGPFGARDELITLYNNGLAEVNITDWCLKNKAAVAFACFSIEDTPGVKTQFILPGYSTATVASFDFMGSRAYAEEMVTRMYEVTSQSSGSIVGSSDVITLVDANGETIDSWLWGSAPPSGKAWMRAKILTGPDIYATNGASLDWSVVTFQALPSNMIEQRTIEVEDPSDPEPGTDPEQETPPIESSLSTVQISEILANASGSDTGKEFIELYNPHPTEAQFLDGLRLRIGLETEKWYSFPVGVAIPPGGYLAFTDADLGFTLPNTQGSVQLYQGNGALGDRIDYIAPKDDQAWALIDNMWQYTVATMNAANTLPIPSPADEPVQEVAAQKPCATNQFRNPETGRCKLIASTAKVSTPCKPGQERNAATGRCRTIATVKEPTPCKEGQERNPETNRCRNIVKMSTASHGVKGVQEKAATQLGWYYWVAIAGIIALIMGYAVWEWRQELAAGWRRVRTAFAKK